MDKSLFADHLDKAAKGVLEFTRVFVTDVLPSDCLYLVEPNCSSDMHLTGDEEVYPDESLPPNKYIGPLKTEEAVDWLWRNGKVPDWINILVHHTNKRYTYLLLECCGRFTAGACLYHIRGGIPPFQITGPNLPVGWSSSGATKLTTEQCLEMYGKFRLPARKWKLWGKKAFAKRVGKRSWQDDIR